MSIIYEIINANAYTVSYAEAVKAYQNGFEVIVLAGNGESWIQRELWIH